MPRRAKTSPGAPAKQILKSEFILANPGLPAKEIVAKGKAAGLTLTDKYVYTIRSVDRSRKQRAALRAPTAGGGTAIGGAGVAGNAEGLLVAVAAEVGLGRAIALLENHRRTVLNAMRV